MFKVTNDGFKLVATIAAVACGLAGSASAAPLNVVNFDVQVASVEPTSVNYVGQGAVAAVGNHWNMATDDAVDLKDSAGNFTTISAGVFGTTVFVQDNGTNRVNDLTRDGISGPQGHDLFISFLTPGQAYDIVLYGVFNAASASLGTRWTDSQSNDFRETSADVNAWSPGEYFVEGVTYATFTNITPYDISVWNGVAHETRTGFNFKVSGVGGTGTGYTNGVQIVTVPEPSSLALLGLGGLLIARRRRN